MNVAVRGIEGQISHGNSFHSDRHPHLEAGESGGRESRIKIVSLNDACPLPRCYTGPDIVMPLEAVPRPAVKSSQLV